jgi:hypothetical protein
MNMPEVKGVNVTNLDASPVDLPDAVQVGGRVRIWYDTYEAVAVSTSDTIMLARLPVDVNVLPQSVLFHDAMGTSSTVTIGDDGDPDRYLESTAWATAGTRNYETVAIIGKIPFTTTKRDAANSNLNATEVIATVGGAAATGTIKNWLLYTAP